MKTFTILTFGCKVNQYESQEISEALSRAGFIHIHDESRADIVIVNSCTVTSEGDRKARQTLRRIKAENPGCVLVLTGCSSQADPGRYRDFPGIDILTGNKSNTELPAAIQQYIADGTARGVIPHEKGDEFRGTGITRFEEHTRAFVKIQDGCDRFCSYCIIPAARGRSRSRKPDSIEAELRALAANGYREIVLTGINLSDYGKGSELTLADAVRLCENIEGICRVRLGSLEPDHITDTLIEALRSCAKLCGHFHISLQSGSDRTLKAMNRHYTAREYLELCEKLRNSFDGCAITTDIMVGFPGETQEDFLQSIELAKRAHFEKIHIFPYSVRKGTRAADMVQLTEAEKKDRARRLGEAASDIRREQLEKQTGKSAEVLFETGKDGVYEGYTRGYLPVRVTAPESITGKILTVGITGVNGDVLSGVL